MRQNNNTFLSFAKGFKDGLPIALGYLSVSFAFGIVSINQGLPTWCPILISVSNFTGTGQFAGGALLSIGAGIMEIAFTLIIINIRYFMMGISLSQHLDPSVSLGARLAISFGITDEVFAVAITQSSPLNGRYLAGLILSSFAGWVSGTVIGALAGAFVPESFLSALGIALYAMFIAIIIPVCRESKAHFVVALIGIGCSFFFTYIPVINSIGSSWSIILSGIIAGIAGAVLFPIKDDPASDNEPMEDTL